MKFSEPGKPNRLSKRHAVEQSLARIRDPAGQGQLVFTRVYDEPALSAAEAADTMSRQGIERTAIVGVAVSIKDLFDVRGVPTWAGSHEMWNDQMADFDAIVMPTVPANTPKLTELAADDEYGRMNLLMLRNPTVISALDGRALTIPCHEHGGAPVGLTIACAGG
ncbi:hypothetical protein ACFQI9_39215 [Paraburkholderia dipogonis]